ncbi:MAG: aminotransferase class V-fold PLP-dependent enzyme, partial [Thermoplasmata archaeon]|nr:aminotransferase class V-fold PLP-dependent enzyme [Thermoplasmata archaeon]
MDINKLRKDFPILEKKFNGMPIVYFDSSCMTLKPKKVIEAINDYYCNYSSCGGRSIHKLGAAVTIKIEDSRKRVGKFLNAPNPDEIVLLKNTTEAINVVSNGLDLKKGDVVLTTDKEHNSNLVPWQRLTMKKGVKHIALKSNEDNTFDFKGYEKAMEGNVKVVSMPHTANLDGYTIPAKEIIKIAHENDAIVVLDGAQSAPHRKVDVKEMDVDFFAFSIHKTCGPTGVGVLYGKYELLENLEPLMVGGNTVLDTTYKSYKFMKPPSMFEAGLQNFAGVIGAGAAIDYLSAIGMENIEAHEIKLNSLATKLLDVDGLDLIGPKDPRLRSSTFNFNIRNMDSHDIAIILDEVRNIMIRSGAHCAHSWYHTQNMNGSARASFY